MRLKIYIIVFFATFLLSYCSQSEKVQTKIEIEIESTDTSIDSLPDFLSPYNLNELLGKFSPNQDTGFVKIAKKHSDKTMYLREETYVAFVKMYNAAQKEGVNLMIRSATRNFNRQKQIWEAKWTGSRLVGGKNLAKTIKNHKERALKILEYSSMPGTSRHHWGTDIDLNSFENSYFEKGKGLKEYEWLLANASSFNFCQPYTEKGNDRPNGYQEEKWHWSYMPIAKIFTEQAELELSNDKIVGFLGAETATEIDVVKNYMLGINNNCKTK